jgi:hypothetical protein
MLFIPLYMVAPTEHSDAEDSPLSVLSTVGNGTDSALSREVVFDVLSSERRRRVLQYLLDVADRATLRDLSRALAAWENDVSTTAVTGQQRKRVYTALKQFHLPKMDRADVIEYDDDRGRIELAEAARNLRVYLEVVPDEEIPWSEYYLGLGAVSSAAVAAAWIGALPIGVASGLVVAGIIALAFTLSAGVHVYANRRHRLEDRCPPLDDP